MLFLLRGASTIHVKNEGSTRVRIGRDRRGGSNVTEDVEYLQASHWHRSNDEMNQRENSTRNLFISCEYFILYHTKARLIPKKYILDSAKCLAMSFLSRYSFCLCMDSLVLESCCILPGVDKANNHSCSTLFSIIAGIHTKTLSSLAYLANSIRHGIQTREFSQTR